MRCNWTDGQKCKLPYGRAVRMLEKGVTQPVSGINGIRICYLGDKRPVQNKNKMIRIIRLTPLMG